MAEGSRLDLSLHQVGRITVLNESCLLNYVGLLVWRPNGPGGESGVVPPVPMPNTAVKRSSAHDTGVTKPRENRPVPGPFGRSTSRPTLSACQFVIDALPSAPSQSPALPGPAAA